MPLPIALVAVAKAQPAAQRRSSLIEIAIDRDVDILSAVGLTHVSPQHVKQQVTKYLVFSLGIEQPLDARCPNQLRKSPIQVRCFRRRRRGHRREGGEFDHPPLAQAPLPVLLAALENLSGQEVDRRLK
jgi:hypothetical protein